MALKHGRIFRAVRPGMLDLDPQAMRADVPAEQRYVSQQRRLHSVVRDEKAGRLMLVPQPPQEVSAFELSIRRALNGSSSEMMSARSQRHARALTRWRCHQTRRPGRRRRSQRDRLQQNLPSTPLSTCAASARSILRIALSQSNSRGCWNTMPMRRAAALGWSTLRHRLSQTGGKMEQRRLADRRRRPARRVRPASLQAKNSPAPLAVRPHLDAGNAVT